LKISHDFLSWVDGTRERRNLRCTGSSATRHELGAGAMDPADVERWVGSASVLHSRNSTAILRNRLERSVEPSYPREGEAFKVRRDSQ